MLERGGPNLKLTAKNAAIFKLGLILSRENHSSNDNLTTEHCQDTPHG